MRRRWRYRVGLTLSPSEVPMIRFYSIEHDTKRSIPVRFMSVLCCARARHGHRRRPLSVRLSVCHKPVSCQDKCHRITRFTPAGSPGTLFLRLTIIPQVPGRHACEGSRRDWGS